MTEKLSGQPYDDFLNEQASLRERQEQAVRENKRAGAVYDAHAKGEKKDPWAMLEADNEIMRSGNEINDIQEQLSRNTRKKLNIDERPNLTVIKGGGESNSGMAMEEEED
jgi:uncharacterized protein with von Willebrand factor type A (vWA) domain